MFAAAAFPGGRLSGGGCDAHHVGFVVRCYVRAAVHVQTPLLFAGEPRERFAPPIRIAANERVELFATSKDRAQRRGHDGSSVHRPLKHALMNRRLPGDPIVIFGIPFGRIDIADHEREIPVGNRRSRLAVNDEPPAGEVSRNDAEELNGLQNFDGHNGIVSRP